MLSHTIQWTWHLLLMHPGINHFSKKVVSRFVSRHIRVFKIFAIQRARASACTWEIPYPPCRWIVQEKPQECGTTNSKHNKHSGSKETKHAYILQNDLGANYSVEDIKHPYLQTNIWYLLSFYFFLDLNTFYEFDILYNLMNLLLIWRPRVVSLITAPKITLFQETVFFVTWLHFASLT